MKTKNQKLDKKGMKKGVIGEIINSKNPKIWKEAGAHLKKTQNGGLHTYHHSELFIFIFFPFPFCGLIDTFKGKKCIFKNSKFTLMDHSQKNQN